MDEARANRIAQSRAADAMRERAIALGLVQTADTPSPPGAIERLYAPQEKGGDMMETALEEAMEARAKRLLDDVEHEFWVRGPADPVHPVSTAYYDLQAAIADEDVDAQTEALRVLAEYIPEEPIYRMLYRTGVTDQYAPFTHTMIRAIRAMVCFEAAQLALKEANK